MAKTVSEDPRVARVNPVKEDWRACADPGASTASTAMLVKRVSAVIAAMPVSAAHPGQRERLDPSVRQARAAWTDVALVRATMCVKHIS